MRNDEVPTNMKLNQSCKSTHWNHVSKVEVKNSSYLMLSTRKYFEARRRLRPLLKRKKRSR